ncbi:hypothetical protein [Pseudofrankia asymbiotica]|uniref:Uncharacterized protein n=1 Tax=Pseudofrankia asymbiotica TaxID=1834516 RepID=A0A1V2IIH0_9ACTN|nr:hypothetical protein [Pseudofrankia asymbiotica]ONH32825.1 hypothetical protein BL253_03630 [Pseudofrankia asymbiotica]
MATLADMPRPAWTADDDDRALLAELTAAAATVRAAEEKMWALAAAARARDIPLDTVAATVGRGRMTAHRHITSRLPAEGPEGRGLAS